MEFVKDGCGERCACAAAGADLTCEVMTCVENAGCDVVEGQRACYCVEGFMGDGEDECTR